MPDLNDRKRSRKEAEDETIADPEDLGGPEEVSDDTPEELAVLPQEAQAAAPGPSKDAPY